MHFILNTPAAVAEIPQVLKGQDPATKSSTLGSADYSKGFPKAMIFGGAYTDAAIERIFQRIGTTPRLPQLRVDKTIPVPPVGPEYGRQIVRRCKERLQQLAEEGKLDNTEDGIYYY